MTKKLITPLLLLSMLTGIKAAQAKDETWTLPDGTVVHPATENIKKKIRFVKSMNPREFMLYARGGYNIPPAVLKAQKQMRINFKQPRTLWHVFYRENGQDDVYDISEKNGTIIDMEKNNMKKKELEFWSTKSVQVLEEKKIKFFVHGIKRISPDKTKLSDLLENNVINDEDSFALFISNSEKIPAPKQKARISKIKYYDRSKTQLKMAFDAYISTENIGDIIQENIDNSDVKEKNNLKELQNKRKHTITNLGDGHIRYTNKHRRKDDKIFRLRWFFVVQNGSDLCLLNKNPIWSDIKTNPLENVDTMVKQRLKFSKGITFDIKNKEIAINNYKKILVGTKVQSLGLKKLDKDAIKNLTEDGIFVFITLALNITKEDEKKYQVKWRINIGKKNTPSYEVIRKGSNGNKLTSTMNHNALPYQEIPWEETKYKKGELIVKNIETIQRGKIVKLDKNYKVEAPKKGMMFIVNCEYKAKNNKIEAYESKEDYFPENNNELKKYNVKPTVLDVFEIGKLYKSLKVHPSIITEYASPNGNLDLKASGLNNGIFIDQQQQQNLLKEVFEKIRVDKKRIFRLNWEIQVKAGKKNYILKNNQAQYIITEIWSYPTNEYNVSYQNILENMPLKGYENALGNVTKIQTKSDENAEPVDLELGGTTKIKKDGIIMVAFVTLLLFNKGVK